MKFTNSLKIWKRNLIYFLTTRYISFDNTFISYKSFDQRVELLTGKKWNKKRKVKDRLTTTVGNKSDSTVKCNLKYLQNIY